MMHIRNRVVASLIVSACLIGGMRSSAHWRENGAKRSDGAGVHKNAAVIQKQKPTAFWKLVNGGYVLVIVLPSGPKDGTPVTVKVTPVKSSGAGFVPIGAAKSRSTKTIGNTIEVPGVAKGKGLLAGTFKVELNGKGLSSQPFNIWMPGLTPTGVLVPVFGTDGFTNVSSTSVGNNLYQVSAEVVLKRNIKYNESTTLYFCYLTSASEDYHLTYKWVKNGSGNTDLGPTRYSITFTVGPNPPLPGSYLMVFGTQTTQTNQATIRQADQPFP